MEDHDSPQGDFPVFSCATKAVHFLEKQLPEALRRPRLGVICGSGLGGLAETVLPQPMLEVPYTSIPHFPSSSGKCGANRRANRFTHTLTSAWPCQQTCIWTNAEGKIARSLYGW